MHSEDESFWIILALVDNCAWSSPLYLLAVALDMSSSEAAVMRSYAKNHISIKGIH